MRTESMVLVVSSLTVSKTGWTVPKSHLIRDKFIQKFVGSNYAAIL